MIISKNKKEETDIGIITLNISLIPTKTIAAYCDDCATKTESRRRTSWMTNNAIPDSIITNMICRNAVPPSKPKVPSTEVLEVLTSMNTLRSLNTIKPVTRTFTAMDKTKLVTFTMLPQGAKKSWFCTNIIAPFGASQVARGDKIEKSVYQMKID